MLEISLFTWSVTLLILKAKVFIAAPNDHTQRWTKIFCLTKENGDNNTLADSLSLKVLMLYCCKVFLQQVVKKWYIFSWHGTLYCSYWIHLTDNVDLCPPVFTLSNPFIATSLKYWPAACLCVCGSVQTPVLLLVGNNRYPHKPVCPWASAHCIGSHKTSYTAWCV